MLSFLGQQWIPPQIDSGAKPLDRLLKLRGVAPADRGSFLSPELESLHDPKELKDLIKAVERIQQAVSREEKILICGDYDVDGVTASAILYLTLQELGAKVSVRLPHRVTDGYGLSRRQIEEAGELGVKLIVTVDNGISARVEIELANRLGLDVIITDHHLPPDDLPSAYAIINPRQADCHYPCEILSGAAVAYKLAIALLKNTDRKLSPSGGDGRGGGSADELLGLATLGTIADVCPLTGENRVIVLHGLRALSRTKNSGLLRIFENAGIKGQLSAEDVGYRIGPRLNSAGRLDSALLAFQALTHPAQATQFADQLELLNRERKALTEKTLQEAEEELGEIGLRKILIVGGSGWHPGVIGLVAGKLAERYCRPVVIMCRSGDTWTGSCRSPEGFNITEALNKLSALLMHFGGHSCAAGFSLPEANRAEFEKKLSDLAEDQLANVELTPTLSLDLAITETDLTLEFLQELKKLEPYGAGNPEPLLLWEKASLSDLRAVGADGQHLSLRVGQTKIKAIGFGLGKALEQLQSSLTADLAFTLAEDTWNGGKGLQVKIVDLRLGQDKP